jgi:DNA-binding MarR family transcriptional regulator
MDEKVDPGGDGLEEAARALLTASRALLGISVRSVAAASVTLTVPQHRLLVLVSADGPRRTGTFAEDLGVNQSNASRLVDRLVERGLVRRADNPEDTHASLVELTDAGRAVLDAVNELGLGELRKIVAQMSAGSRRTAAAALRDFNDAAHEGDALR